MFLLLLNGNNSFLPLFLKNKYNFQDLSLQLKLVTRDMVKGIVYR